MNVKKLKRFILPIILGFASIPLFSCINNMDLVVEVVDVSKEYDGIGINCDQIKILSGSILKWHHYEYSFEDIEYVDVGEYKVSCDFKIYDFKNNDVTSKYNLEIVDGYVDIYQREITYKIFDKNYVYCGNTIDLNYGNITSGSLANNQKLEVKLGSNVDLVNVNNDIYKNSKIVIKDENLNDVTKNYSINFIKGKVNIIPRQIEIKPNDINKTYDGNVTNPNSYSITKGSLVNNDNFELTYNNVNQVDVCNKITTSFNSYKIVDTKGNDVSSNYSITAKTGTLSINKKEVILKTNSCSKEYDGEELSSSNYETEGLIEGDYFDFTNTIYPSITLPSTIENKFTNYSIKNSNNKDVTNNYSIIEEIGILQITGKRIDIVGKSCSWVYDGKTHDLNDEREAYSYSGDCESLYVRYDSSITEVGSVENTIIEVYIDGKASIKSIYYDFHITNGTLSIIKDAITINLLDIEKVYDGNSFGYDLDNDPTLFDAISKDLVLPEGIYLTYNKEDYSFIDEYEVQQNEYTIDAKLVDKNGNNLESTYKLVINKGTYTIKKATYDMSNISWIDELSTYDGNEHEVFLTCLPDGVSVNQYSNNKFINAGTYYANCTFNFDSTHYNEPIIEDFEWTIKKANNSITKFEVYDYNIEEYVSPLVEASDGESEAIFYYSLDNKSYSDTIPSTSGYYYVKAYIADTLNYKYVYSEVKNVYVEITDTILSSSSQFDDLNNSLNSDNITFNFDKLIFDYSSYSRSVEDLTISLNRNYLVSSFKIESKALNGVNTSTYNIDIIIYDNKIYSKINETNNNHLIKIDYFVDNVNSYSTYTKTSIYSRMSSLLNVSLDTIYKYFNRIVPITKYYASLSNDKLTTNLLYRAFKTSIDGYEIDYDKLNNINEELYYYECIDNKDVYGTYLKYVDSVYENVTNQTYSNRVSSYVYNYISEGFGTTLSSIAESIYTNEGIDLYKYLEIADDIASRYSPYHDFIGVLGKIKDNHATLLEVANQYPTYRVCDLVAMGMGYEVPVSAVMQGAIKIGFASFYSDLESQTAYDSFADSIAEAYAYYSFTKQIYYRLELSTTCDLTVSNNIVNSIEISMDSFVLDNVCNVSSNIIITLDNQVDNKYNSILNTIISNAN